MSLHHNQDIRKMGGLKSKLPVTYACFLIGTLCIIGFPLTSGFFSKDLILEVMLYEETTISFVAYIMLLIGALVTTIYSLRLMFIVFYGKYRDGDIEKINLKEFEISHVYLKKMTQNIVDNTFKKVLFLTPTQSSCKSLLKFDCIAGFLFPFNSLTCFSKLAIIKNATTIAAAKI